MKLNAKEKQLYSEKILDLGNLAVAALIFGQFLSNTSINFHLIIGGIIFYILCLLLSHLLQKE